RGSASDAKPSFSVLKGINTTGCLYFSCIYRRYPKQLLSSDVSNANRSPAPGRLHCRVGEDQGAQPVRAAGRRCRAAGDRGDELVELAPMGLGIALEKEMQRLLADDAVAAGIFERALDDVAGAQHALLAMRLDALVVA